MMMTDGPIKAITQAVGSQTWRRIYLVPLFLATILVYFLLNLSIYKSTHFAALQKALLKIPLKWNKTLSKLSIYQNPLVYSFDNNSLDKNEGLQEQTENETVIFQDDLSYLELWEQPNLLNLPTFSWLMNNQSLCQLDPSFQTPEPTRLLPILVHTARSNFDERTAIRKTWGSVPIYKNWDVRVVFLLGDADRKSSLGERDELEEQDERLKQDQLQYGDMVMGSFVDSYRNLTYKHLMGYKWILNFCSNATFVMKVDDDMFIDIIQWIDWRTEDLKTIDANSSATIPDLYCNRYDGTKPVRAKDSKWYASKDDWPKEWYPDYCSGWGYGMPVSLMRKLYSASKDVKFFWIDDVFATGVLMEEMKNQLEWEPEKLEIGDSVTTNTKMYKRLCRSRSRNLKREFGAVVYIPRGWYFEKDMMCMWNKTLQDSSYNFTVASSKL